MPPFTAPPSPAARTARRGALLALLLAGAVALLAAVPAAAVDSPRLSGVTCRGLHVRQAGLPRRAALEVKVSDAPHARTLAEIAVRSSPNGVVDVSVHASFAGAQEFSVEVETPADVELSEAIYDFPRPCPAGQAAAAATS